MSVDESILESEIDRLITLKKHLKNFEVDSNLEDIRRVNFIINSVD